MLYDDNNYTEYVELPVILFSILPFKGMCMYHFQHMIHQRSEQLLFQSASANFNYRLIFTQYIC